MQSLEILNRLFVFLLRLEVLRMKIPPHIPKELMHSPLDVAIVGAIVGVRAFLGRSEDTNYLI
jgi:hypothetical protein